MGPLKLSATAEFASVILSGGLRRRVLKVPSGRLSFRISV